MMNVETIRRKVTKQDVEEIARLMATRRLTETGCCLIRGISDKQWWNWKSKGRNKEKFTDLFTRIRESKLDLLVERIENASEDAEISVGDKIVTKRGDWRAAAWIAEKIAPERFAQQTNIQQSNREIPTLSIEAMKRVYASEASSPPSPFLLPAAPARPSERSEPESIDQSINSSIDNRGEADDQSVAPESGTGFNSRDDDAIAQSQGNGIKIVIPPRRVKTAIPARRRIE